MTDEGVEPEATRRYVYRQRVLDQLIRHGLVPLATTPPERLRDAVSDLYRVEIRAARADLLAGRIERRHYADHIVKQRQRYWLLSIPTALWVVEGQGRPEPGWGD